MGKGTTVTRSMYLIVSCLVLHYVAVAYNWHTPPSQWDEPRLFHSSTLTADIEARMVLTEVPEIPTEPEAGTNLDTRLSPNGVYWLTVVASDTGASCSEADISIEGNGPALTVYSKHWRFARIGFALSEVFHHYTDRTLTLKPDDFTLGNMRALDRRHYG